MRNCRLIVPAMALMVVLAGCAQPPASDPTTETPVAEETITPTPTPTPTPSRPALADLVVTTGGLGTLHAGGPVPDNPDPALAMVSLDPSACVEYGATAGSPQAAGWVPAPEYLTATGHEFDIYVEDGVLKRLDIYGKNVRTDQGIHIGDSRDAFLAANSGATLALTTPISEVYVARAASSHLTIEVTIPWVGHPGYWSGLENTVLAMRVEPNSVAPYAVAGGDNSIFGCSFTGA